MKNMYIKKTFFLLILVFLPVLAVFGADFSLSFGSGGLAGVDITRYTLSGRGDRGISGLEIDMTQTQEITQVNFGGFLFFDATWAEFSVFCQGGSNTYSEIQDVKVSVGSPVYSENKGIGEETVLGLSLLGKYPFTLNERFTVFPLLGAEYRIALMEWRKAEGRNGHYRDEGYGPEDQDRNGNPHTLSAWNAFWIDVGGGVDYHLFGSLYLRGEFIYGFRLQTPYEVEGLERIKKELNDSNPRLAGLTSGPTIRLALGYRFF